MKTINTIWLCTWLVMGTLSLSACGGESSENLPNNESEEPTVTPPEGEGEGEESPETPTVDSFEPAPFDPADEVTNNLRQLQRQSEYLTLEYTARLATESLATFLESFAILAADPERQYLTDLCWSNSLPCAGDIRLYDWKKNGYGLVEPVLFTNRTGAIISGHVWATQKGPEKRPTIVITSGSIQATEQMYWWAAQTLAKAGYIVMTTDPQNQGRSDTFGAGKDVMEGVPPQLIGYTFFDGTVDALDFILSNPDNTYCPQPARSGNSHCEKQERRVNSGLNAGYNPFWAMVDADKVGLAGHSYGASGVSYIGQQDPRVKAIVAWDNLCSLSECQARGGMLPIPELTVPALGISNDYMDGPIPQSRATSTASIDLSEAGVDSGQLIIRGGTHFEYSYLPLSVFAATHRGIDLAAWYTQAWFDKYLKADPTADKRLLTTRWQNDSIDASLDKAGKGNMFSYKYGSRMKIKLASGANWHCEDLRTGCEGMYTDDGEADDYSFLTVVTTPE